MAHMEDQMRPPDLDPGAIGSYHVTHYCVMDGQQLLHMELSDLHYSHQHGRWLPFNVSAVVENPHGHHVIAIGEYMVMELDFRNRHCIVDIGYGIGRRVMMTWHIDRHPHLAFVAMSRADIPILISCLLQKHESSCLFHFKSYGS